MPILFLDFDGVILTLRTTLAHKKRGWSNAPPDPVLCSLIAHVCDAGARIVVCSAWRDIEQSCKAKLAEADLVKFLHADWCTPDAAGLDSLDARPFEIADWLKRHPEETDYLIADDDHFRWTAEQEQRWLRCCPENGMMADEMRRLADWLPIAKEPHFRL